MTRPRLAVVCDPFEEGWPSMDLFAEMLVAEARAMSDAFEVEPLRWPIARRFGLLPGPRRFLANADRMLARHVTYPRRLARARDGFSAFHVVDHSYAHVVNVLPAERTGVYCYDLDAFRSLIDPAGEPRPWWFRAFARRTLSGLARAAVVFVMNRTIEGELARHRLVDPARVVVAPPGIAPGLDAGGAEPATAPFRRPDRYLLHVGATVARKRVDVAIDVFAALANGDPDLRFVQIGGEWTDEQRARLAPVAARTIQARGIDRPFLAHLYRGAALVLLPSEREGFGLPIAEGLACGAPVLASDIPTARDTGGDVTAFAPVGDVAAWVEAARRLLAGQVAPRERRIAWARERYSWRAHARAILDAYRRLIA